MARAASTGFSGLLFGYAYMQGGLWASIGAHALLNSFLTIENTAIQHFKEKARAKKDNTP
jgi:membrane protease YdiL (CAAX protease family)